MCGVLACVTRLLARRPSVEVCLGDGVHKVVLQEVMRHMRPPDTRVVTLRGRDVAAVWVGGEDEATCGWSTVARFVGRRTGAYPSAPERAVYVDGCLEMLDDFLRNLDERPDATRRLVRGFVQRLDADYFADSGWIVLERKTIADACVYGALQHVAPHWPPLEHFPSVDAWRATMAEGDVESKRA